MTKLKIEPTLYLLARWDIPDMNAGKLAAQAAHAASEFEYVVAEKVTANPTGDLSELLTQWREDRSFGRTITLKATNEEIYQTLTSVGISGYVFDPTYPIKNHQGDIYTVGMSTVGWCFPTNQTELSAIQESGLELYP